MRRITSTTSKLWGYMALSFSVLVTDQLTKMWAIINLTQAMQPEPHVLAWRETWRRFLWTQHPRFGEPIVWVPKYFDLRYVENPGAAWGFLSGSAQSWRTPFFLSISLLAMVFIIVYWRRTDVSQKLLRVGLALVFGGAMGNFFDRVRLGYVIDFIDWHIDNRFTWPTFNLADAAITVGVGLLLCDMAKNPEALNRVS